MRARRRSPGKAASLLSLGTELAMLGVEAQMVIGKRMAMFMLGGPKACVFRRSRPGIPI